MILAGCGKRDPEVGVEGLSWEEVVEAARGQTVYFDMWLGDLV